MGNLSDRVRATNAGENEMGYAAGASRTSMLKDPSASGAGWEYGKNIYDKNDAGYDEDLYRAAILQRYIRGEGGLKGSVESYAGGYRPDLAQTAMKKYLAQASQRREMKGQLSGLGDMQAKEENMTEREGLRAVGEGVKNTRQNFNQRGLLYGGMREGGESQVKSQGAATIASNLSGVKRDYANQADALKSKIASIGMANQQEALQRQQMVMETSMRNQVARNQAYQQLGEGVGYAAGSYYGREKAPATEPSNSSFMTSRNQRIVGGME